MPHFRSCTDSFGAVNALYFAIIKIFSDQNGNKFENSAYLSHLNKP